MMVWLSMTPHSPETEQKRLAILAGFAFLTGWLFMIGANVQTVPVQHFINSSGTPLRSGSWPHAGLCHRCQPKVSETSKEPWPQRRAELCVWDYRCFRSIIVTAFMGTSVIFICFTLSALYAKRRSYLFLGGEGQRVSAWSADCSWVMLSHCCLQVPWCLASLCSSSCRSLTSSSAPSSSSRYSSASIWHAWHARVNSNNRHDGFAPLTTCAFFLGLRVLPGPHVSGADHHVLLRPVWHSAHHRKSRKWGQRLRVVSLDWWTLDYSLHLNVICSRRVRRM